MNAAQNSPSGTPAGNRLAREKSPYLLQHRHNPVDWYAWGADAFARAKAEAKPIFLSIGYSTCHWCHVMERESFESPSVAEILNEHFVSIKVDREERPDVDKIYMTFVQATTGQGGWPLSVFLTPDLKPFYGGTYYPPDNRHGRPGFSSLLQQIAQLWETRRDDLLDSAEKMHARLDDAICQGQQPVETDGTEPKVGILHNAAAEFKSAYDSTHGGFGGPPKFPQPSIPQFLLRYGCRFGDAEAIRMVLHTCDRMAAGGLRDQLGGGFARYSVDGEWLVPHFEKMLYDNAQLAQLYLDAFLVSKEQRYAEVVRDTLDYVRRDMTHPEGGFYSAEDADSEGHEGKFYCWTMDELRSLLTGAELAVAVRYFGLTPEGNFVDHSHPSPLPNQNVLSVANPELNPEQQPLLASARRKMLEARSRRVRPHLDDKVLGSWNGMMLGAFARAYAVLGDEAYLAVARKNVEFVQARMWDPVRRVLHHRWRDGECDQVQLVESYAFMLSGVLELYEAALNPADLEFAQALAEVMIQKFYDTEQGGFWQSEAHDLILKIKEDHDGAEPSGNSVAVLSLLRLGRITGREEFTAAAQHTLRFFNDRLHRFPHALPFLLQAVDFITAEPLQVVIAGAPGSPSVQALARAAHSVLNPSLVGLGTTGPVNPFARTLKPSSDGKPLAYFCTGTSCQSPTSDPEELQHQIRQHA